MKRTALALTVVLLFLEAAATQFPSLGIAQTSEDVDAGDLLAASPHSILIERPNNHTIYRDSINLNVTVDFLERDGLICWQSLTALNYSVDDKPPVIIVNNERLTFIGSPVNSDNVTLSGLADGQHKIEITAVFVGNVGGDFLPNYVLTSTPVYFTMDTTPPVISNLSVENKTYYSADIPLNFTVNEVTSHISYSLDNHANLTINGNTTLTGLTEGSHNLTVYANDTVGNMGATENILFTISKQEPFPTTLVIATSVIVAGVIAIGLFVYFKKRKEKH